MLPKRFGLPIVAPLPSSTHIVHFYQHGKELLEVFAQFCCAGLEDGDCCFWVTTPPWTAALALHELEKRLPAEQYVARGQLQLILGEEWYLTKEGWDIEGTLAAAAARLQDARRCGWSQVRVCGVPRRPGSEEEWRTCLQYEQTIHRMVTDMEILALCAYRLGGIHEWAMNGLRQWHHAALSYHNDGWCYQPTASF